MIKSSVPLAILAAAAIGPVYALPGRSQSVVNARDSTITSSTPATTSAHITTTEAAAVATETIIIAALGEGEHIADGNSKWLTYWITSGAEPDWCNDANSSHTITDVTVKNNDPPPTIFYGSDDNDPDYMDGCSFDSAAATWGCSGWSASCDLMQTALNRRINIAGNILHGKALATCDKMEVLELYQCIRNSSSSTASQTIEAPTSATTTTANPAYTASCNQKYKDLSHWKSENMDDFLKELDESIPTDYDGSFIDFLNTKIDGTHSLECDFGDDATNCQASDTSCAEGDNARYYFIQTAVEHYFKWVTDILNAIESVKLDFAADSLDMTQDFIRTDLPDGSDSLAMFLLAGVLGSLGGLLGAAAEGVPSLGAASAVVGSASGDATVANGVITSAEETAAQVIQNELDELAGLQNLINNTITTTSTIIKDWGNNILNGKIKDQKASSSLIPHTAVGVFTGGGFASDPLSSDVISGIHKSVYKYMWSTAIGYLWNSQNIYIIKLSSDLGTWGKPCDIHLDKNMARVCDGDTAYLFGFPWSEQQDGPIYGADDDTLAAYDLTLLELAKGAKKTQDTYGFAKNIDDSSKSAITKNYEDPSSSTDLFVGIPLCDLDAIEDFWRSHKDDWDGIIMTAQGTAQYIAQQSCAQYNITIDSKTQSWPLSEKDFPTKRLWL